MKVKTEQTNHMPKMAEDITSMRVLKRYLCIVATGGLTQPQNKRVEAACAACKSRCAYGQRFLDLYWAEEDRQWERERAKEYRQAEEEEHARLLSQMRSLAQTSRNHSRQAMAVKTVRGMNRGGR